MMTESITLTYSVQESNHVECKYRGVHFQGTYYGFCRPPRWYFSTDDTIGKTGCGLGFEQRKAKGKDKSEFESLFTGPARTGVERMVTLIDERLDGAQRAA